MAATVPGTEVAAKNPPTLESPVRVHQHFRRFIGDRLAANEKNWLLVAPESNPAMLQIFRDRDRSEGSRRDLLPWSGEFAGKYLISCVQCMRMSTGKALAAHTRQFVRDLIATQRADGYFGPFPATENMLGKGRWDLWGQYHVMLGLLLWYRETGEIDALAACRRCADHFCKVFLDGGHRVIEAGSEEMNESSIHVFTLLYSETGEPRFLRMAREIEKDWETPPSGDYVRQALAGKPFYAMPKPRWESLPGIQAIAELYFLTGEEKYRRAFESIWWSILEGDRHNTGGFSSGEQATGNPYDPRPIETCCTIAWMALTLDYLRMTGDSRAADELELSTWNAVAGAQCAAGRWWTYNTPMDGERKASAHDIVFQARAGSPELNCCSVNGPRGLGILSSWAVMQGKDGVALNWFGPASLSARLPSGQTLQLDVDSNYPTNGHVRIVLRAKKLERFVLRIRIPGWSDQTTAAVNGEPIRAIRAGSYLALDREWRQGDRVELVLDMRPWVWAGEREAAGKVSVYRGPILLAYDPRFEGQDHERLPQPDLRREPGVMPTAGPQPAPLLLVRMATVEGGTLTLCDFASAGAAGNRYASWLPCGALKAVPFSRENPLRSQHPAASRGKPR